MLTRRDFLKVSGAAGVIAAAGLPLRAAEEIAPAKYPRGRADACIFIWLGGGCAQIDTFDPKGRGDGKKQAGCYYETIDTAIKNVRVCEHLKRSAPLLDRFAILRSLT